MVKKKKEKRLNFTYPVRCFRLSKEVVLDLDKLRGRLTWNKFFLAIIRTVKGIKCSECGATGILEKHHIKARADGGGDNKKNIRYLCVECHKKKTRSWWKGIKSKTEKNEKGNY